MLQIGIIIIIGFWIWQLFLKPYNYKFSFKEQASPILIFRSIEEWVVQNNSISIVSTQSYTEIVVKDSLEVMMDWDIERQTIAFHFCFLILSILQKFKNTEVFIKHLESQKALKATYFGNYKTSDRELGTVC